MIFFFFDFIEVPIVPEDSMMTFNSHQPDHIICLLNRGRMEMICTPNVYRQIVCNSAVDVWVTITYILCMRRVKENWLKKIKYIFRQAFLGINFYQLHNLHWLRASQFLRRDLLAQYFQQIRWRIAV